ncbi:DUF4278 domain-containing protein [Kamptonema formosum]|uniref:DUF4278 domain-containing protein n=1 Tax=Kamptonema formosum TaxID=331992 RepID=UPI00034B3DE5|nr:DUF4278 domain-containing protein [Oscillatoria sp. PCC 10802]
MKLTYRGASAAYELPTTDMLEGDIGGTYRGQPWRLRYPRHMPEVQPIAELKYRGVPYGTGQPAQPEARVPPSAALWQMAAFIPKSRKALLCETAKIHRANLYHNLERRMQAAIARGDKKLLQLLESEFQQLAC